MSFLSAAAAGGPEHQAGVTVLRDHVALTRAGRGGGTADEVARGGLEQNAVVAVAERVLLR